jgi:Helix-loop-helix DNA-binding domain
MHRILFVTILQTTSSYTDTVTKWLRDQTCDGNVRRRRKVTRRQRMAANDRERRRMHMLNDAFDRLRETIPVHTEPPNTTESRPLSRIQTLRLAIDYIAFMTSTLDRYTGYTTFTSVDIRYIPWRYNYKL